MSLLNDREFAQLADTVFRTLEAVLDTTEADLDYELVAGGVLQLEFSNGSQIIINRQAAAHEIWVAAKSGGFHYRWDGQHWRDTKSGEELFDALSGFATAQAGEPVDLVP